MSDCNCMACMDDERWEAEADAKELEDFLARNPGSAYAQFDPGAYANDIRLVFRGPVLTTNSLNEMMKQSFSGVIEKVYADPPQLLKLIGFGK